MAMWMPDSRLVRYYKSLVIEVEMILSPNSVSDKIFAYYRPGLLTGSGLRFGRYHARRRCLSLCLTLRWNSHFDTEIGRGMWHVWVTRGACKEI
jgi:hypothetical protein